MTWYLQKSQNVQVLCSRWEIYTNKGFMNIRKQHVIPVAVKHLG